MLGVLLNDRYRILEVIGEGGMASVYRCIDERLKREVAVKILHPHLASDADLCRRFQMEASISARLESVNILKIFDAGTHADGRAYIVSELLRGRNFHELQGDEMGENGKPFDPVFCAMVCEEALKGLAVAHAQGVVHRDVKPDNIVITNAGAVKLMDFGIAKNPGASRTVVGHFLGSPCYSSPEQIQGDQVDSRSDLYSMGIILYEALSGALPFDGQTPAEVMLKIVRGHYLPLRRVQPGLPEELERVVMRALDQKPQNRFESAQAMAADIRAFLGAKGMDDSRKGVEMFLQRRRMQKRAAQIKPSQKPVLKPQPLAKPQPQQQLPAQQQMQMQSPQIVLPPHPQLRRPAPPVPTPGQTRKFRRPVSVHRMAQAKQALIARPTMSRGKARRKGGSTWAALALFVTLITLGGMLAYVSFVPGTNHALTNGREEGAGTGSQNGASWQNKTRKDTRGAEPHTPEMGMPRVAEGARSVPETKTDTKNEAKLDGKNELKIENLASGSTSTTAQIETTPTSTSAAAPVAAKSLTRNLSARPTQKAAVIAEKISRPGLQPTANSALQITPVPSAFATPIPVARLQIQTVPGGLDVYLDDDLLGKEDGDGAKGFEIKPGAHVVRVRGGDVNGVSYMNFEKVVNFEAGKTVNLSPVRLKALRILSISIGGPGVVVKVDGEQVTLRGRTADLKLPEGRHKIEAKASNGRSFERTIVLQGENLTVNTSLE